MLFCVTPFFFDSVTPTCANGKVYETCGTACPLTCENYQNPPQICPAVCRQGCFCPAGLVEYNNGCVAPSDCPGRYCNTEFQEARLIYYYPFMSLATPTCSNRKVYEACGTACPLTCDNYQNAAAIPCTLQCVQGCFCPQGMVESNDRCVAPSDCPAGNKKNTCNNISSTDLIAICFSLFSMYR